MGWLAVAEVQGEKEVGIKHTNRPSTKRNSRSSGRVERDEDRQITESWCGLKKKKRSKFFFLDPIFFLAPVLPCAAHRLPDAEVAGAAFSCRGILFFWHTLAPCWILAGLFWIYSVSRL